MNIKNIYNTNNNIFYINTLNYNKNNNIYNTINNIFDMNTLNYKKNNNIYHTNNYIFIWILWIIFFNLKKIIVFHPILFKFINNDDDDDDDDDDDNNIFKYNIINYKKK